MYKILDGIRLGIQSYTLRTYSNNEDVAAALRECGIGGIELSKQHIDVFNSAEADRTIELYKNADIEPYTCGIHLCANDEEKVRPLFEFAKKHDMKVLCVDPDPDAFEILEKLCVEYGVKLAIHNHGRKKRYGTVEEMQNIYDNRSEHFGFCLDTAWIMETGADPAEVIRKFGDRIFGLHFKDFTFDGDDIHREVILGKGNLNLASVKSALTDIGYKGFASLEYEGNKDDPIPGIKQCIDELMKIF